MKPDFVEVQLESKESDSVSTYTISLNIIAYLTENGGIEKDRLVFDCDPAGSNYRRTYLDVKFEDWGNVVKIRDFLAHHLSDWQGKKRRLTVPVEEGYFALVDFDGDRSESDEVTELTISASENRIEFGGMAMMTPYIYNYTQYQDGKAADEDNATELLDFFEEITAEEPIPFSEPDNGDTGVHRLFNQYSVTAQLKSIAEPQDQILVDYEKAIREFNAGEYSDTIRDVGRAGETLIEELCLKLYGETGTPVGMTARLNKLDKTEDGPPSYIGKALSPAWWLRNKANHPSDYEITKADAHYALLCFQTAIEKYVEDYLEADVRY